MPTSASENAKAPNVSSQARRAVAPAQNLDDNIMSGLRVFQTSPVIAATQRLSSAFLLTMKFRTQGSTLAFWLPSVSGFLRQSRPFMA